MTKTGKISVKAEIDSERSMSYIKWFIPGEKFKSQPAMKYGIIDCHVPNFERL